MLPSAAGLLALPAAAFINPQVLNILAYGHYGIWMWQFDGKLHVAGGQPSTFEPEADKRPVTLWWEVLQMQEEGGS